MAGYATSIGEYSPEVNAVAAPVIQNHSEIACILCVIGFTRHLPAAELPNIGTRLATRTEAGYQGIHIRLLDRTITGCWNVGRIPAMQAVCSPRRRCGAARVSGPPQRSPTVTASTDHRAGAHNHGRPRREGRCVASVATDSELRR
jgi:hypothetical protein